MTGPTNPAEALSLAAQRVQDQREATIALSHEIASQREATSAANAVEGSAQSPKS